MNAQPLTRDMPTAPLEQWSKPDHGVQHLATAAQHFQITVENFGTFVEAYVLCLNGSHPFQAVASQRYEIVASQRFETVADAQKWAEARPENTR